MGRGRERERNPEGRGLVSLHDLFDVHWAISFGLLMKIFSRSWLIIWSTWTQHFRNELQEVKGQDGSAPTHSFLFFALLLPRKIDQQSLNNFTFPCARKPLLLPIDSSDFAAPDRTPMPVLLSFTMLSILDYSQYKGKHHLKLGK